MQDLEQTIREKAYHLWIADDCRDGNAHAHWLTAQREVLASALGNIARVTSSEQPAAAPKSGKSVKSKVKSYFSKRKRQAA